MGKGDKRSRKGKIFKGSYGKTRKHAGHKVATVKKVATPKPAATPKAKSSTRK